MINLAGKADADQYILTELTRCGVPVVPVTKTDSEVPYSFVGKLGNFTFTRAWYYWVVSGKVPLAVAEELYTPEFKGDVRSGGDCGCRHPSTWATPYKGEKVAVSATEAEKFAHLVKTFGPSFKERIEKEYYFHDNDDLSEFPRFVDTYHIDSELGLYIFVQALKRHNLV